MAENGNKDEGAKVYVDLKKQSYTFVPSKKAKTGQASQPREKQFISIDLNVKTGMYYVKPYVMGPVSWTEFGEPTALTNEQFDTHIVAAVLDNLDNFNKAVFEQALAHRRTSAEQKAFVKQHLSVFVARLETNEIKVSPQHREGGGYTGDYEHTLVLQPEEVSQKLAQAIREAFSRAT